MWNKPDTQGQILYNSTSVRSLGETERRTAVLRGGGKGGMGLIFYWVQMCSLGWWKSSGDGWCGSGCKTLWSSLIPLNCMLKMVKIVNFMYVLLHYKNTK